MGALWTFVAVELLAFVAATSASQQADEPLSLKMFADSAVEGPTCNDGSPVGYYARLNNNSRSWIVYLQGGGFCAHEHTCATRLEQDPDLMSSLNWRPTRKVGGILSADPAENPYLWDANHVLIPYCSSDLWSGLSPGHRQGSSNRKFAAPLSSSSFSFMGSAIVSRVFESLLDESALAGASFVLLAGDSAGATGVLLNVDRVGAQIRRKLAKRHADCDKNCEFARPPEVRGLADSGWLLDWQPSELSPELDQLDSNFNSNPNLNPNSNSNSNLNSNANSISTAARHAHGYWNGQMPADCANFHEADASRCYFGHRAYRFIKSPVFLVQWLYDEAQLLADSVERPDWRYFRRLDAQIRASLANVSAVFAPSCVSHSLVNSKHWNQVSVDGFRLPRLLNLWQEHHFSGPNNQPDAEQAEHSSARSHPQRPAPLARAARRKRRRNQPHKSPGQPTSGLSSGDAEVIIGIQTDGHGHSHAQQPRNPRQASIALALGEQQPVWSPHLGSGGEQPVTFVSSTSTSAVDASSRADSRLKKHNFRLIDSCGWPQCNRDCPVPSLEPQLGSMFEF